MRDRCPGCGALFQCERPDEPGYLPPGIAGTDRDAVCRRCYRLSHYGRVEGGALPPGKALEEIASALGAAGATGLVLDLGDIEGCLPPPGLLRGDKPLVLAVNKIDLLPPRTSTRELTSRVAHRWREAARGPSPAAVVAVSAARGTGLDELAGAWRKAAGGKPAAVIGATSVGKSTLIRRLLAGAGKRAEPTVSRFPGTTQARNRRRIPGYNLALYDTPGFVPGDRLIDRLCPDCAALLVSIRRFSSKLFHLQPGEAVVFGGFAAFILAGGEPRTFICYAGETVCLHRTRAAKAEELLDEKPDWLMPRSCSVCRGERPLRREEVRLGGGEDLVVAGLGWLSLRGGGALVEAVLPEGIRLSSRSALFGPRSLSE